MPVKSFNIISKNKIHSFNKSIIVDSDKSISIRSFLLGAISENITLASNVLESEDVFSTIRCLKRLGVVIKKKDTRSYYIHGKGLGSLYARKNLELDFGNSGTLARLLIGILSTSPNIEVKIKGDHSLNKRDMGKLIKLMNKFGAFFLPKNKFNFPLKLISSNIPIGINYEAGVSAQLKSAVILAGLNSYGKTEIIEQQKSIDHTENILVKNPQVVKIINSKKKIITIFGKKKLKNLNINVPGDPSSAAFFTALTLMNKSSMMRIKNICLNPTRIGFYKLLKKHGAKIIFVNQKKINNEIRGDIIVKSSQIKPIQAKKEYYVNSTDEYPILFVIAALISGVSKFKGIGDLANKESNRITEMQKVLKQLGIKTKSYKNELKIYGNKKINIEKKKIIVPSLGDHRICMSTFVLAILTGVKTKIKNFDTVFTSSPTFLKIMKYLGAKFEIQR